jgi:hypothetical protein
MAPLGRADGLAEELCSGVSMDESARTAGKAFEHWRARRAPSAPVGELLVLAWLLDHPHWQWSTAKSAAWSLDRYSRLTHGTALVGRHVTTYLTRLGTKARSPLPLTEPLRGADVADVSERLHELDDAPQRNHDAIVAMRDGLAVLRLSADPAGSLGEGFGGLSRLRVEQHRGSTVLVTGDGVVVNELSPQGAALWAQHLPLLERTRVVRRACTATALCGLSLDHRVGDISEAQWEWLWRMLDSSTPRRLRDHAYLLLGFEHARRHAELRRLNIEHVTATGDGFTVLYEHTKNGDDFVGTVAHHRGEGRCVAYCPACAVQDLLWWERCCMRRTTGPLLATRYGGSVRAMTRQNGRLRVQWLTGLVAEEPWGSTRSLRAGAATTAWEAGWPVQMIAEHVTGHRDVNQTDQYIRRHGATGRTLQLRLM